MSSLPFARCGFHYNTYSCYLEERFGERVQRVSLDGAFTCPNRDGSRGSGGCIYCNNLSFSPPYASVKQDISKQLEAGIRFLKGRFGAHKFIAFFQSRSNTYAPVKKLERLYRQALDHPDVVGLAVSTRPDCLENDVLELLKDIGRDYDVNLEIGIESLNEASLRWMNRCHDLACTRDALDRAAAYGIDVTGHMILGLPTETREEMLESTGKLNILPLKFLKLHHLQIIRDTALAKYYSDKPFPLFGYEEYLAFVAEFIAQLRSEFILQRVISSSPDSCLIAPKWRHSTTAFVMDLQKQMRERELYQGLCANAK
ncbi:MAG: TIGR01212 family radical SAM protein [Candidatus Marinimicrobia bacterium]|nr:TIGR01212 family radical SAM protein [Candidatus Neomarinimicrobiota bacterium]MDD5710118.1 TIGR01212 family radical SAM protein [Candidatus Neomarinimicrobiota bacterium]